MGGSGRIVLLAWKWKEGEREGRWWVMGLGFEGDEVFCFKNLEFLPCSAIRISQFFNGVGGFLRRETFLEEFMRIFG